jgi:predicted metalloprotease with PDZ domain
VTSPLFLITHSFSFRRQSGLRILFSACVLAGLLAPGNSAQGIHPEIAYELSLANPSEHLFHVSMTVRDVRGELLLEMPAWNATYQIRDFASRIEQVIAESDAHQPISIEKVDKQTWRVRGQGTVTVRYAIFWDSPGPFASQLSEEHAFINPAMVFLYVPDRREKAVEVNFRPVPDGWRVASLIGAAEIQAGVYSLVAPSYDALADSPMEIGPFKPFRLSDNPRIDILVHGDNWLQSDVESTLRKVTSYEIELMGGAPFDHYLFILHIGKAAASAGGGMEHADGTAISVGSTQQLAFLAAHEFFHLWNVKRIRPATLEPVDYAKEQYTRALWFAEGVTSTYGGYTLVRTGLWKRQDFYADLAQQITELEARPANRWQSAEQSSLDAWLEKYPYYNGPDFSVSYYSKGQLLGVLLDILIRDRTGGERSLDDVLLKMNQDFARKNRPYRDSLDVRLTAEAVAGGSFEDFFRQYVAAAEPLPYAEVFGKAGLLLEKQEVTRAELGFTLERDGNGKAMVHSVQSGSPPERSGLRPGDEVESFNGEGVPRRAESWVRSRRPGDLLRLGIRRNDQSFDLSFALGGKTEELFAIDEDPHASPKARSIREGLLHGVKAPAKAAAR